MNIEGFRALNQDIETIINKSEAVKKARREAKDKSLTEKFIKFAMRVPVFMYLTDYRERCLKDVITQLEPGLFRKVTGLTVKDFELLVDLGVFNSASMNDAVYNCKRHEDASLSYTRISQHGEKDVGLFGAVLSARECKTPFVNMPRF